MMKILYRTVFLSILMAVPATMNAQVLITLLFGEALNSEKIEFGLIGGMNRSYILDIEESTGKNNLTWGSIFTSL